MENNEELIDDTRKFFANDTTQKFVMTIAVLIILQVAGMLPNESFVKLLGWSIGGFWGANGLDLLTNLKKQVK